MPEASAYIRAGLWHPCYLEVSFRMTLTFRASTCWLFHILPFHSAGLYSGTLKNGSSFSMKFASSFHVIFKFGS